MTKPPTSETVGWRHTCDCYFYELDGRNTTEPCTVLDPFAGAGTTLWRAKELGRKAVGIEISEDYCKLAARRVAQQVLPLDAA